MGRRSLLLLGLAGMFVFYAVMTISFRYEVRLLCVTYSDKVLGRAFLDYHL